MKTLLQRVNRIPRRCFSTLPSSQLLPFSFFQLPANLSTKPSTIIAAIDADYHTPHPQNSAGSRLFATQAHSVIKHPEKLYAPEEVDAVLQEFLSKFIEENKQLLDADFIVVMPSSKGPGVPLMYTLAQRIQESLGAKAKVADLLIRKSPMAVKTTKLEATVRKAPGAAAKIQFPTLVLNDKFKQSLKGATILVVDDNLVFGNVSEASRSLFSFVDVEAFKFLAVCNFGPGYFAQNIAITEGADPYTGIQDNQWNLLGSRWIQKPKSVAAVSGLVSFIDSYPQYSI